MEKKINSSGGVWPPQISLAGWGRYPVSPAHLVPVHAPAEASRILAGRGDKQVLGRGAGRAYGDSAINRDNLCLDYTPSDRFLSFDEKTGILHAEAGVTLEQVIEHFVPRGWFLPATPGTKYPTLGGSVACDVHGKSKRSIGHFIVRLHMLLADRSRIVCSPKEKADLFWATIGGMGLTGLIESVEIKLMPVETSQLRYEGVKARDLEHIFQLYEESDDTPMTVAWIDCLAQGRHLGRSIMMRGGFAKKNELKTAARRRNPLELRPTPKVTVPLEFPAWSLNKLSVAAFNTVFYGKHPQSTRSLVDIDTFFYPLDKVLKWNRIYGKPGMAQYQFLIPPKYGFEGIKTVLEAIAKSGRASFLAVLKKFGPVPTKAPLSFPTAGYFIALDFPVAGGAIFRDMDRWDELVLKFGGRLYLAKDSRMRAETFAAMYPRLKEWQAVKAKYDPDQVFCSDQARRLGLMPGAGKGTRRKTVSRTTKKK